MFFLVDYHAANCKLQEGLKAQSLPIAEDYILKTKKSKVLLQQKDVAY